MPTVDDRGIPIIPLDSEATTHTPAPSPTEPTVDFGTTVAADRKYDIERIVGAYRVSNGWKLVVKWEGYPDTTNEPASRVQHDVRSNPELLKQIEQRKQDYLDQHPKERELLEKPAPELPRPQPTRVQPTRARNKAKHFMFHLQPAASNHTHQEAIATLTAYAAYLNYRNRLLNAMLD